MPVEVRELIIKATISNDGNAGSAPSSGGDDKSHEVVRLCVEKVLEIIKDKHGR